MPMPMTPTAALLYDPEAKRALLLDEIPGPYGGPTRTLTAYDRQRGYHDYAVLVDGVKYNIWRQAQLTWSWSTDPQPFMLAERDAGLTTFRASIRSFIGLLRRDGLLPEGPPIEEWDNAYDRRVVGVW